MKTKGQYYGICEYCNQTMLMQIPDETMKLFSSSDEADEYLSQEASKRCSCAGARAHSNVERRINAAIERCREITDNESIQTLMMASISSVMKGEIEKLTIKDSGNTFSVYLDGDERIHIKREHKVVEEATE